MKLARGIFWSFAVGVDNSFITLVSLLPGRVGVAVGVVFCSEIMLDNRDLKMSISMSWSIQVPEEMKPRV